MNQFDMFDTLGFLTINTAFQAKQNLNTIFQSGGMDATVDQFVILSVLLITDGIGQKELSGRCYKSDSNLTRILNGMENKGLILRQKGKDARSRTIHITKPGRVLYEKLAPMAESYNRQLFQDFSKEEQAVYRSLLMKMRESLPISKEKSEAK